VFRYFNVKNLNLLEVLEKREPYRDAFLYEKLEKTDYLCGTPRAYSIIGL
jgi:hypothetical protein